MLRIQKNQFMKTFWAKEEKNPNFFSLQIIFFVLGSRICAPFMTFASGLPCTNHHRVLPINEMDNIKYYLPCA